MKQEPLIHVDFHYIPEGEYISTIAVTEIDGVRTVGFADCSPSDRFVKRIGRKIALARALQSWDRPNRSAVWKHVIDRGIKL